MSMRHWNTQAPGDDLFRVWPDGSAQSMDEDLPDWRSDDYALIWAPNDEAASRMRAKLEDEVWRHSISSKA